MRRFIKKLQEAEKGSGALLNDRDLSELKEYAEHKGYFIVAKNNRVIVTKDVRNHEIDIPMTERDAVRIYKTLNPVTYTRKTPLEKRFRK